MIISMATEFIENPRRNASKQDCELNSFRRLSETVKKEYSRLPIRKQKLEAEDLTFERI